LTTQNLSPVTVKIGDLQISAYSAHAGIAALPAEHAGMPVAGTVEPSISFQIDLNNQSGSDIFQTVKELFNLCNQVTAAKVKPIKLEFWKDQTHQDVHLTMNFDGWVSSWHISSGNGQNHILAVSLQPKLDMQNFIKIDIGN
jgi:hypothetical protein